MEISELYQLSIWVTQEITDEEIIQKFTSLQGVFNHNVTRPPDQPLQSFQEQHQTLVESLKHIDLAVLSLSQLQTLDEIGIKQHIDPNGINRINELMTNTDMTFVRDEIKSISAELGQGVVVTNAINSALDPIVYDTEITLDPEKILARVIFDHEASVHNFEDLEEWSIRWIKIVRGLSAALGLAPDDVEIVGATDGSHIIKIIVAMTLATAIAKATTASLESLVQYQEYRNKALEHRIMIEEHNQFNEKFESMAVLYEEMAEKIREDTVDAVTKKLEEEMDIKRDTKGELNSGVKHLINFYTLGGNVDISIPDDMEEVEEGEEGEENKSTQDVARINESRQSLRLEYTRNSKLRKENEVLLLEYDSYKSKMEHVKP